MKAKLVIIGGGHAGIEAAKAALNLGVTPLLVTSNIETIGTMSCNPAVGGVAKGHVVRELDALSGVMPKITDMTTIQRRTLNASKGAAVRSTRAQCDKRLYNQKMVEEVISWGVDVIQGLVASLKLLPSGEKEIILDSGISLTCEAVVLTTGTFLQGLMHMGEKKIQGGRFGERGANTLTNSLHELGVETIRLKTGTPPRILKSSIDFSSLTEQHSDETEGFHWKKNIPILPHTCCYLTETNEQTHEIIQSNKERSPIFNGDIAAAGPRYCPSIEDKVFRFPDKKRHQIFLEPEGLHSIEFYPNGISTSLPIDVQLSFVRSIRGLHNAQFTRPGYAVEYDAIQSFQLDSTLQLKTIPGIFTAGQINGTSGYEEAAGQGLVAGLNAARMILGLESISFQRSNSYLGVMIDDLIRWELNEPYRLMTCRAESRLSIREDNVYERMLPYVDALGLWDAEKRAWHDSKMNLKKYYFDLSKRMKIPHQGQTRSVHDLIKQDNFAEENLNLLEETVRSESQDWCKSTWDKFVIEQKYIGYVNREFNSWQKISNSLNLKVPVDFDFNLVQGLSAEMKQRLIKVSPKSLLEISKMDNINPSAVTSCFVAIKIFNKSKASVLNASL